MRDFGFLLLPIDDPSALGALSVDVAEALRPTVPDNLTVLFDSLARAPPASDCRSRSISVGFKRALDFTLAVIFGLTGAEDSSVSENETLDFPRNFRF